MEMFDSYHLELDRRLESMRRKQEMILTKQDQIQSTLHGDTATIQSPSLFTGPGVVTPPFTSPTSSVQTFPPFPAAPAGASTSAPSDVTSMFNCELESLLSLDWSPLPVNLKSAAGPPVSLKPLVEHSGNVARERGPLTDFLTTGKLPPVCTCRRRCRFYALGSCGRMLQSLSAENAGPPKETVVAGHPLHGLPWEKTTAGPQPIAGQSWHRLTRLHLEPPLLQATAHSQLGPPAVAEAPQLGTTT